jgi:hypothetical protein
MNTTPSDTLMKGFSGVLGPEAFDAVPFLNLLAEDYRSPWGLTESSERS